VAQFLSDWLGIVKPKLAPATYVSYEGTIRLHLMPALSKIPLANLGAVHVEQLKRELLETVVQNRPRIKKALDGQPPMEPRRLSGASVSYCLRVLRMALG
jgi:Phage integrase, N-terminal SAM-like domain